MTNKFYVTSVKLDTTTREYLKQLLEIHDLTTSQLFRRLIHKAAGFPMVEKIPSTTTFAGITVLAEPQKSTIESNPTPPKKPLAELADSMDWGDK